MATLTDSDEATALGDEGYRVLAVAVAGVAALKVIGLIATWLESWGI
jgi:hypothetical protein